MDSFDKQMDQLAEGCLIMVSVALVIIGLIVLIATHIQWK